jgi:3-oxoacyl-[acyl-carrier protein] reductase
MASLHDKVVLITGASRGIGKAIAVRLAKEGALVVINYSSDSAAADAVVKEIGDHAIAIKADVSRVDEVNRLVEETVKKWGKIDVLINSAGIMPMMDLASSTEETYDKTFAVNVKGPYFLTQVVSLTSNFRQRSSICLLAPRLYSSQPRSMPLPQPRLRIYYIPQPKVRSSR